MTFAEKLDLLMNITNTSNSVLARSISMDASFISRLRRGVRTPAKNVNYIQAMADCFSRNCRAEYQKAALWEAIRNSSELQPSETGTMTDLLYKWLRDNKTEPNSIDDFLEGVIHFQFKRMRPVTPADIDRVNFRELSEVEVLYGVKGKQTAILAFLSMVLKNKSPQTLLLYSDEDLGWLTDNPEFTAKWAALLAEVIRAGNRLKIIHTINRSFDEMLAAIKEWVPLYMTGAIEPYYYPRTRDGLFRRTLFIAPLTAAVTSSSVGSGIKNTANLLFTKKDTVNALISEFNDFLALCRPLMRIFTPCNKGDYLGTLAEFEEEEGATIVKTDVLTNMTMPPEVVTSILTRIEGSAAEQLLSYQHRRIEKFNNSLENCSFTEIFPLPDLEAILAGQVVVNFSDMLTESRLCYTPAEYYKHLQNIIRLLKTYHNYHVHLVRDKHLVGSMVYVKEDVGVLVGKTSLPSVIFAINQSNMTAAFWDYLNVLLRKELKGRISSNQTIAELEALAAGLEAAAIDV